MNGPDAIDFVPGAFMTKHEQGRIGGGKLQMPEPIGAAIKGFCLARGDVAEKKLHRIMLGEAFFHHGAFGAAPGVGRLDIGEAIGSAIEIKPVGAPIIAFDDGAAEHGFVGVNGGNFLAAREF